MLRLRISISKLRYYVIYLGLNLVIKTGLSVRTTAVRRTVEGKLTWRLGQNVRRTVALRDELRDRHVLPRSRIHAGYALHLRSLRRRVASARLFK